MLTFFDFELCLKPFNHFIKSSSIRKSISIDSFYTHTAVERSGHHQQLQTISQNKKLQKFTDLNEQDQENDSKKVSLHSFSNADLFHSTKTSNDFKDEDPSFFDALSRIQSNRLDDQRCSIKRLFTNKLTKAKLTNPELSEKKKSTDESLVKNDEFFNLIMKSQRSRLEDQRTSMSNVAAKSKMNSLSSKSTTSSSLTENSSSSYTSFRNDAVEKQQANLVAKNVRQSVTVPPDDAFFSMIQKIQSRRLDEQRSVIKSTGFSIKNSNSGSTHIPKKIL